MARAADHGVGGHNLDTQPSWTRPPDAKGQFEPPLTGSWVQRNRLLERSSCTMIAANLRIVRASPAREVAVGELVPSFERFYTASVGRLFTALCLVTGDRHEAEEITQEAFVRVFERWDRVAEFDDPTGYLFRVSMNVFRSRYRRTSLAVRRALFLAPKTTDDLAAVDTHDAVVRLLRGLDPKQRAAVVLTALLGYPAEEAGRMLGIGASSVRSLTTRARAQMKLKVVESA
jgi:RNA polymerase sigma-70 factor (ECF subfamily)